MSRFPAPPLLAPIQLARLESAITRLEQRMGRLEQALAGPVAAPGSIYTIDGARPVRGPLDHDGQLAGFFNAVPQTQAAAESDATTAHAITDPADTPASVDALRDDLVANTIPDIEEALDDLGAKINVLIDFAQRHGLMAS